MSSADSGRECVGSSTLYSSSAVFSSMAKRIGMVDEIEGAKRDHLN